MPAMREPSSGDGYILQGAGSVIADDEAAVSKVHGVCAVSLIVVVPHISSHRQGGDISGSAHRFDFPFGCVFPAERAVFSKRKRLLLEGGSPGPASASCRG